MSSSQEIHIRVHNQWISTDLAMFWDSPWSWVPSFTTTVKEAFNWSSNGFLFKTLWCAKLTEVCYQTQNKYRSFWRYGLRIRLTLLFNICINTSMRLRDNLLRGPAMSRPRQFMPITEWIGRKWDFNLTEASSLPCWCRSLRVVYIIFFLQVLLVAEATAWFSLPMNHNNGYATYTT